MFSDYSQTVPCKIGTIPKVVIVHKSDVKKIKPDTWIRIKEYDGGPWTQVLVRTVNDDGHFQADR